MAAWEFDALFILSGKNKQLFLPPATKLGQGYIFTGVCDSVHRGGGSVAGGGGVRDWGVCMAGGHAWLGGACMVGGICGKGGMCGRGVCIAGGHAWPGGMHGRGCDTCPPGQTLRLRHTVNKRTVRILLECILVQFRGRFRA